MITAKRPMTIDDLMNLPPEVRAELIEGELFMSPAPGARHQEIVANLTSAMSPFVRTRKLGKIYPAPIDVVLSPKVVLQPDLVFVSSGQLDKVATRIECAPDLVVEILSPSTDVRDRVVKRDLYGRHGVREYWLVDPETRTVEVLKRQGDSLVLHAVFEEDDAVASTVLTDLNLRVQTVFE